jgi:hypothetical protein
MTTATIIREKASNNIGVLLQLESFNVPKLCDLDAFMIYMKGADNALYVYGTQMLNERYELLYDVTIPDEMMARHE